MAVFQTRHYQAIAQALQQAEPTRQSILTALANMFQRDNAAFNRDLFLAACEPGANVQARTAEGARKRK